MIAGLNIVARIDCSDQGVYLENCNGNHYETVVCVQQPQMQSCYGYCKVTTGCNDKRQSRRKSSVVCAAV